MSVADVINMTLGSAMIYTMQGALLDPGSWKCVLI